MKRTLILLLATLFAVTSFAQVKKAPAPYRQGWDSHWADPRPLYGNVESVVYTEYKLKDYFGEIVKGDLNDKAVFKFKRGDVIDEKAEYDSDGSQKWKNLYKYDSVGNEIEWARYDSDGSLDWKDIYKYDSAGNKIEEARYNSDGSLDYKDIYKYDSKGNVVEKISYKTDIMIPQYIREYKITYRE
ncbi:MAG: hypothetical protein J6R74_03490 [Tidjanibacter sp.]|nr:hypothetical protein [Tidjanibacter sp.]